MAAKRLISAWVYPDITGKNYGLRALRLRLDQLEITENGDTFGSGEWRLWLGYSNAVRPWTRLINSDNVDQKTYSPSDSIFEPGALGTGGLLKGEVLEFHDFFPFSLSRLRLTGYEQDTFGSDDVGEVDTFVGGASGKIVSVCEDQTAGEVVPTGRSGCAAYNAHMIIEPGQTPVSSVLSPQTKRFLNRLLVGEPSLATITGVGG